MTIPEVEKLLDNIGLCNYCNISIDSYGNPLVDFYIKPYEIVITDKDSNFINSLIQYDGFKNERDVRNTLVLGNRPESEHIYEFILQNRILTQEPLTMKDTESTHYEGYCRKLMETISKLLKAYNLID